MTLAGLSPGIAVAVLAGRFAIGLILAAAAVPKLVDRHQFEHAIAGYQLLPRRLVSPVARVLPSIELTCGVALLAGIFVPAAALIGGMLLVTFSIAAAVNLLRGRTIDCGCGGAGISRQIGWDLVFSDLLLAAAAVLIVVKNVRILEPPLPLLLGHSAPFGDSEAIAVLLIVSVGALLRELFLAYLRFWNTVRPTPPIRGELAE